MPLCFTKRPTYLNRIAVLIVSGLSSFRFMYILLHYLYKERMINHLAYICLNCLILYIDPKPV